jgi:hypothetical protein
MPLGIPLNMKSTPQQQYSFPCPTFKTIPNCGKDSAYVLKSDANPYLESQERRICTVCRVHTAWQRICPPSIASYRQLMITEQRQFDWTCHCRHISTMLFRPEAIH